MATAAELLAGELIVDDAWFEVDLLARRINIPKSITNLGAKSESDVTHVKFKLPRFLNDIDFADFEIGIDYTNAQGEEDRYEPKDVTINEDTVTFTWVVGRHAALYQGNVTFGLCAKRQNPSDPDNPLNEFHTTKASLPILDAMETCEEAVIEHADLLEQWRRELFGAGNTIESEIRAVGAEVLATIPEDYQATVRAFRSKADAITSTAQGEIITVSDSSDDPIRGLKIFGKTTQTTTTGKNLFEHTQENTTINGVTITVNDDRSITVNGTCTSNSIIHIGTFILTAGESYTLTGCPAGGSDTTYRMDLRTNAGDNVTLLEYGNGATTTVDNDTAVSVCIRLQGDDTVISNKTFYPMIRLASVTDATYEPYTGGAPSPSPNYPQELINIDPIEIKVNTKNLLPNNISSATTVNNGVTYTLNNDGSITAVGTVSSDADSLIYVVTQYAPFTLPKGTYVVSGISGGSADTYRMLVYKAGWNLTSTIYDGEKEFALDEATNMFVYYWIKRGTTVNTTFYPMIRLASVMDPTYEPSAVQTLTISTSLPGIPVSEGGNYTDPDGQQWVCDEIDFERGVHIKRVGIATINYATAFNGISAIDGSGVFHTIFRDYDETVGTLGMMCNKLVFRGAMTYNHVALDNLSHGQFSYLHTDESDPRIYFAVSGVTTSEGASEWLKNNSPAIYYPIKNPIETPLTAEELSAFQNAHSNFPITTVLNDSGATMELKYNSDTKTYLENCFRPTDKQVQASVDTWLTAHYTEAEEVSF